MASALPLFRTIGHQLLIVALVILSLPIVISILWKLRLFPLGCYFVATKLFWPRWVIYALSDFLIMMLSWLVKQSLRAFLFQEVQP